MVIRRMLTGDPGDLTQRAEAVGPELSLASVAMPVRCRRQKSELRAERAGMMLAGSGVAGGS
jgi:hypothetical protein